MLRCRALPATMTPLASRSSLLCAPPAALLRPATISLARFGSGKAEAAPPDDAAKVEAAAAEEPKLVYEGAKNKIVKTLKKLSVANLGFAVAATPVLQYITAASGSSGKGVAMSGLLLFFGGGTTGALTWATTTYVLKMVTVPGKDALLITTPTFTGGEKETEVAWSSITRPMGYHPFATFEADGQKYYLDELGEMHDASLPAKLEEALNK